jgi:hypothetical protein
MLWESNGHFIAAPATRAANPTITSKSGAY